MCASNGKVSEMTGMFGIEYFLSGIEDSVFVAEEFIEVMKCVEIGIGCH